MSFSGRPPPMTYMPPTMMPMMPNSLPPMNQPPPRAPFRASGPTINSRPQMYNTKIPPPQPIIPEGPIITVFVGNISERAPDIMIKKILQTCGMVVSWKRVSTFGFCEYDGPVAGLCAVRLLHDLTIDSKKLVAKVDAKNKILLDQYQEEESKKGNEAGSDTEKQNDSKILDQINSILADHKEEMNNTETNQEKEQPVMSKHNRVLQDADMEEGKRDLIHREIGKFRKFAEEEEQKKEKEKDRKKRSNDEPRSKSGGGSGGGGGGGGSGTSDVIIIGSDKSYNDKQRRTPSPPSSGQMRSKDKDKSKQSSRNRNRSKSRSREREREREREMRERDMREMREREREREEPKQSSGGGGGGGRNIRDMQREKEIEEELRERKKAEKKAREKESAYQERLKIWETRERRKAKDYEKEREKDRCKEEDREKEAKRLKEFLEDYDDERDDSKYYKGREMQRRLAERVREADLDGKDRNKEQEELEELKSKIFGGEYDNPNLEFERLKKEREDLYKPKLLIDVNLEQSQQREREQEREKEREIERQRAKEREKERKEKYVLAQASRELAAVNAEPIDSESDDDPNNLSASQKNNEIRSLRGSESRDSHHMGGGGGNDDDSRSSFHSGHGSPNNHHSTDRVSNNTPILGPIISLNLSAANAKKKKLEIRDVFNMEDENEESSGPKKRKLVPLDYDESAKQQQSGLLKSGQPPSSNSKQSKEKGHRGASSGGSAAESGGDDRGATATKKSTEDVAKNQEEKRKHIKSIIDRIPTEKIDLFNFKLDWSEIDSTLMDKKIRPWIHKKIIEYIGEPEPTLVDFICSKVMAGSSPQVILDDVQMVLDEEAEVFVVKMWRLLIYEVEAKKSGIVK